MLAYSNFIYQFQIEIWFYKILKEIKINISDTGNEAILEGVKITGDRLRNIELDGTLAEELTFYFDTSDECKEECSSR